MTFAGLMVYSRAANAAGLRPLTKKSRRLDDARLALPGRDHQRDSCILAYFRALCYNIFTDG